MQISEKTVEQRAQLKAERDIEVKRLAEEMKLRMIEHVAKDPALRARMSQRLND